MATARTEVMRKLSTIRRPPSHLSHIKPQPQPNFTYKKKIAIAHVFCGKRICDQYTDRFHKYATADFLVVIRDPERRGQILGYLSKFTIRSDSPKDQGRSLVCIGIGNSEEALRMVTEENKSFGVIIMDAFFGADHCTGYEAVRLLRKREYPGCIAFLTPDAQISQGTQNHVQRMGADAILINDTSFMREQLRDMIRDLVIRKFSPANTIRSSETAQN